MRNVLLVVSVLYASALHAQQPDLVRYVNTLQGTNSSYELSAGNTYPTTGMPFNVNAWSPQTGKNGDGWKYKYSENKIRGFGETHQCSPWVGDYGVFTLMPVAGELVVDQDKRAAVFNHKNETAKPHYYQVRFDNGVNTEIAPTERAAMFRFSFPKGKNAHVVLDGYTKLSAVSIDEGTRTITGYVTNGAFVPKGFRNYFRIVFDKPFRRAGTWENKQNSVQAGQLTAEGEGIGAFVEFAPGSVVTAKVVSSYISSGQALVTLERETGQYTRLEQAKDAGFSTWNKLLNRVKVEGGTEEERATFYSCLFRANLFSHQFFEYDAAGKPVYYSPYDAKLHEGYMFTDNGFWDTFRSQFPLTNILHPTMQGRYMQALLDAQQQCGWLPAWSAPSETGGMLGNHAISLLTDAWAKGIRGFSADSALKAYYHEATNKGPWGGANGRAGWKEYYQLGYVPYPVSEGSTAQTLEYAYDDFCAYNLAKMTGNTFYETIFARHMYNYRNVFDSDRKLMRGRQVDGEWTTGFDPFAWGGPYTEGNAWHYNWSVFQDIQGLIDLTGGDEAFVTKIDSVFSQPNTVNVGSYGQMIHEMTEMVNANLGQYAHGNQPIQHMIYLYSYAGAPWKTQARIREVMDKLYNSGVNGYPGDEDQGGMSSWYVLSAMGIYSVTPGTDEYVLGSPVFSKVTIEMENGKKFVIEANGNSKKNVYIRSASLNGQQYDHNWIRYSDISDGGILKLEMSAEPNRERGLRNEDKPFSLSKK
ncbi:MAG: glycoside hydrolase family 92 protein [Chitinophagaceae bacterium]|nr:MAG: glycoside hydrolase family 92 protein [Chitinophagaceae bacterium]